MLIGDENNNFIVPNWRSSEIKRIVSKGDIISIIYAAKPYIVATTVSVKPDAVEVGCRYITNGT